MLILLIVMTIRFFVVRSVDPEDLAEELSKGYKGSIPKNLYQLANMTTPPRPTRATARTYPPRQFTAHGCDNLGMYCFKAYSTGRICARTVHINEHHKKYRDFKNYCEMDYVNCVEGFDVWILVHMGECIKNTFVAAHQFEYYEYLDDLFLDQNYVIRE